MSQGRIIVRDSNGKVIDVYKCPRDNCDSLACSEVKCSYFADMTVFYKQHTVDWDFDD